MSFSKFPPSVVASIALEHGFEAPIALAMQATASAYHDWLDRSQAALDRGEAPPPLDRTVDRQMQRFEDMWDVVMPPRHRLVMPFRKLAELVGPLIGGEILTIAGTTAGGKTTTTMNLVYRLINARRPARVHLVATEMCRHEIRSYLAAFDTHLWPDDLVVGNYQQAGDHTGLSQDALMTLVSESVAFFHAQSTDPVAAPLHVTRGVQRASALPALFARAAETKRDVVVIDHLGLFDHDLPARTDYLAAQATVRLVKTLAERHDVAVILVSQINMTRYVEGSPMARFRPPKAHHLFGGQQLPFISSAMLTIYRPKAEYYGNQRELVSAAFVRQHLDSGGEIEDLFERGITGYSACKIRRGTRSPVRRANLQYYRGFLFDELPDFRIWFQQSPAAFRREEAALGDLGDAWEPGIARENDDGKATP